MTCKEPRVQRVNIVSTYDECLITTGIPIFVVKGLWQNQQNHYLLHLRLNLNLGCWYQKQAHIFLIAMWNFRPKLIFIKMLWTKKCPICEKVWLPHTQKNTQSLLWDNAIHIFVANMNTTGAISLKIWNRTIWTMGPNAKKKTMH